MIPPLPLLYSPLFPLAPFSHPFPLTTATAAPTASSVAGIQSSARGRYTSKRVWMYLYFVIERVGFGDEVFVSTGFALDVGVRGDQELAGELVRAHITQRTPERQEASLDLRW